MILPALSVVVPAFNEAANIPLFLPATMAQLSQQATKIEWLLVDDGSSDGTADEFAKLSSPHCRILRHEQRQGLGGALWSGLHAATLPWYTWLPADGQVSAGHIASLIAASDNDTPLTLLLREEEERSWDRRALTWAFYHMIRLWVGFDPYGFSGVFLARRSLLSDLPLLASTGVQNYAVVLHALRQGHQPRAVRARMAQRLTGRSKVANTATITRVLYEIGRLKWQMPKHPPQRR